MRVLMIGRDTLNTSPGGDTVQIQATAKYLRALGVQVDVLLAGDKISYQQYNLIHFFNIIRPDDILPHIQKTKLPFAVSTIFVDYSEYEQNNRKGLLKLATKIFDDNQLEYLKAIARFVKNGDKINSLFYLLKGHKASVRYIAGKANILLPNSHNEYKRFAEKYHVKSSYLKVPNAIDTATFDDFVQPNPQFKNHILCVGRIEGRKNQLNLIKALDGTDFKLTLIGKPSPNHLAYYAECKNIVDKNSNMQIIAHIDHKELAAIYKAAKVHVLPSWFETTGLSSLEAAMMGCNIVVTKKGDTEEYFGNMAYYCNPEDILSIKEAVSNAFSNPFDSNLKENILQNYTWEKAAAQTLKAYQLII